MENGNGNGNENGNGAAHGKSEGGKVEFVIVPGAWYVLFFFFLYISPTYSLPRSLEVRKFFLFILMGL